MDLNISLKKANLKKYEKRVLGNHKGVPTVCCVWSVLCFAHRDILIGLAFTFRDST